MLLSSPLPSSPSPFTSESPWTVLVAPSYLLYPSRFTRSRSLLYQIPPLSLQSPPTTRPLFNDRYDPSNESSILENIPAQRTQLAILHSSSLLTSTFSPRRLASSHHLPSPSNSGTSQSLAYCVLVLCPLQSLVPSPLRSPCDGPRSSPTIFRVVDFESHYHIHTSHSHSPFLPPQTWPPPRFLSNLFL